MKRITTIAAVVFVSQLYTPSVAIARPPPADHRILVQPDAPLVISDYAAKYQFRTKSDRAGVIHTLRYRNVSERTIVAFKCGLLAFDVFNEFQGSLGGYAIRPIAPDKGGSGQWLMSAGVDSSFYTGVAYLSKVRFEDGEVWSADLNDIAKQVQGIEADFSMESLHE